MNSNGASDLCQPFGRPSFDPNGIRPLSFPDNYQLVADSNLKIADFNFDGLPDLLGIYSIGGYRKVSILSHQGNLQFRVLDGDISPLNQLTSPLQACLYDYS